ncbi:MAG: histidine phosphatase family protein [Candidatus Nealsonbacteria bacterium]
MKLNNIYYLLRHGQALSNVNNILSCWPEKGSFPLTKEGEKQIERVLIEIKKIGIDLIFSSDILRTKQTAEIIGIELNIDIEYDKRLREHNVGIFNSKPIQDLKDFLPPKGEKRFEVRVPEGETYAEIKNRMLDFLTDIDKRYKDKNILIVSHELPLALLEAGFKNISNKDFYQKEFQDKKLNNGELRKLN